MMIDAPKGNRRFTIGTLALVFALGACHDDAMAPKRGTPPIDQLTDLGTYIVDVNVKTGQIVTHQVQGGPSAPSGVDALFFGSRPAPSRTPSSSGAAHRRPGTHTRSTIISKICSPFLSARTCSTRRGVFPEDTMGVFVYMAILPTVTAGCTPSATCKVAADSGEDGAFPFTTPTPQPYMFFKTILEATTAQRIMDSTSPISRPLGESTIFARSRFARHRASRTSSSAYPCARRW